MKDGPIYKDITSDESYRFALSALADDELPKADRAALLERLANDAEAVERLERYRAQNAALKAMFPVRPETVRRVFVPRRVPWYRRAGVAAGWLCCGLALGIAAGWLGPAFTTQPAFARNADMAYAVYASETRHAVEVEASDEKHLMSWLSKRLDRPLTAPSLQEYGYVLKGGRLLPDVSGPAAQFMYEDASGNRLTLYITAATRQAEAIQVLHKGNGQGTYYWVHKGMGYALSGRASKSNLQSMAIEICTALGGNPRLWQ